MKQKSYPDRYDVEVFDEYSRLLQNRDFESDFQQWKQGINYKTQRQITIGGKTHDDLSEKFKISCVFANGKKTSILFSELNGIDYNDYSIETKRLRLEISEANVEIEKFNKRIDRLELKISKLTEWDQFVTFNRRRYGVPHVTNNIHRENNCGGEMICVYTEKKNPTQCKYKSKLRCNKCDFIQEVLK